MPSRARRDPGSFLDAWTAMTAAAAGSSRPRTRRTGIRPSRDRTLLRVGGVREEQRVAATTDAMRDDALQRIGEDGRESVR